MMHIPLTTTFTDIVAASTNNYTLRTAWSLLDHPYTVDAIIKSTITVGANTGNTNPAYNIGGSWHAGSTIKVTNYGTIKGNVVTATPPPAANGQGGLGGSVYSVGGPGYSGTNGIAGYTGGPALAAPMKIFVDNQGTITGGPGGSGGPGGLGGGGGGSSGSNGTV